MSQNGSNDDKVYCPEKVHTVGVDCNARNEVACECRGKKKLPTVKWLLMGIPAYLIPIPVSQRLAQFKQPSFQTESQTVIRKNKFAWFQFWLTTTASVWGSVNHAVQTAKSLLKMGPEGSGAWPSL